MMSFDSWLLTFIKVLSRATRLRDLKFIGVRTSPDHEIPVSRIPFPSLETLLLRDIWSNTLRPLLAISSATYRLNLFLNENSFLLFTELDDTPTHVHIEQFCTLFEEVSVHTLSLEGELDGWLAPTDLSDLIISMADLKSLKFHKWRLDEDLCDALTRPPELDTAFPSLQSLHITHSTVWDVTMFRGMIASYSASLELVRLGIDVYEEQGGSHWKFLDAGEPTEFWGWLRDTVHRLEVVHPKYVPPEFEEPHWRMWD